MRIGRKYGTTYEILISPEEIYEGNDSFLHELIHHSRMVDDDREGILLRSRSTSRDLFVTPGEDRSLEEAATVLETFARMTPWSRPYHPSYHQAVAVIKGRNPFALIDEDRKLATRSADPGSEGLKGEGARTSVEINFEKSNISFLILPLFSEKSARERLRELEGGKGQD